MAATLLCLSFAGALAAPLPAGPGVAVNVPAICLTAEAAPAPIVSAGLNAAAFASDYALAGTGFSITTGADTKEGAGAALPGLPVSASTWRIVAAMLGVSLAE